MLLLTAQTHALDDVLSDTDQLLEDAASATEMPVRKPEDTVSGFHGVARVRGLNKLTAQKQEFIANVRETAKFGTVEIMLEACWQTPPDQPFEAKALVELWENRPNFSHVRSTASDGTSSVVTRRKLFHGWIISGEPALSGLEHPVYVLELLGCGN